MRNVIYLLIWNSVDTEKAICSIMESATTTVMFKVLTIISKHMCLL